MDRWWLAAAGAWVLCSCAADGTEGSSAPQLVVHTVGIEASAPATRTELTSDGYNVQWSPGDRIGVYVESGGTFTTVNAPMTFSGTEAASSGTFYGELTLADGASSYTLYAYYPYDPSQSSSDATGIAFTLSPQQTQRAAGDSTHLGDSDFLVAAAVSSTDASFPALSFSHAFAVVELDLTASGTMAGKSLASITLYTTDVATVSSSGALSDLDIMAGSFTFDLTASTGNNTGSYAGGSAQIGYCGLSLNEQPVLGSDPVVAYLTINPADYSLGGGDIYFVVTTADGYTSTFSLPGIAIAAGQMKVVTQELSSGTAPQPTVSLSSSETANCYIASVASQSYSFDATVAGNGVITPGLQSAVQRYEGRTLSATLSGGSVARLLWQSKPNLIEPGSVTYADGQISFTLTGRPTELGGNAVIALYPDATSDEAIWSWHIWITDSSNEELLAAAETYVMAPAYEQAYGVGSAVMMDRNLGAIYKEDGPYARSFRATLFQWGRKDPFPWGQIVFDENNVPLTFLTTWNPVQSSGSLGFYENYTGNTWYATAHPETFIATTNATSFDWYYGAGDGNGASYRNDELWGNPLGYNVGQTTTKTLFDPCPPGWMVPHPYVFTAFTTTGSSAAVSSGDVHVSGPFLQGWNFLYDGTNTTYYPGVGFRYDEYAVFSFLSVGCYWSSSPAVSDLAGAAYFGLTAANVYIASTDPRGFGLPVRCMRE